MWNKLTVARNAAAAGLGSLALSAYAAVPTTVTDALDAMKEDALTVAGLVLIALIAVAAFKFMRKGF